MRILTFLHDAYGSLGGISRNNRDVIEALAADKRVQKIIAVPRIVGATQEALPAKLDWRRQAADSMCAYLAASFKALFGPRPDFVLCLHIRLLPVAWLASLLRRAPLWLMIFGIDAWERPRNPLLTWLSRRAHRVISISEVTTARFQSWAHLPADRMRLLPCIVDLDLFRPGPPDPALIARYGLAGKRVLFTFGRLVSAERAKGMDEVMEAMPGLLWDNPDLVYLIGGGGPDRTRLEAKAKALGLAGRVIFAGRIAEEEKVAHYRITDAYVMPSRGEGFGIVILEALGCGIPALASRKDGGREALLDGKLGLLVDPDDPASVSGGIREVLARPKGRPAGLVYYSIEANRERVSRLLDEIAPEAGEGMSAQPMNNEPIRIAYLVSHPIQYQSPLLRLIAAEPGLTLKAFYRSPMGLKPYTDEGFGQVIAWDTPLLDGFEHEFLPALDDPMRVTRYLRPLNYGLARRLRQGRFDVLWVHGYARVFNLGAMLTAKRLGIKVMLRDEMTPISMPRGPAKKIAKRAFFAGLWTLVDAALAIGSLNRRYYLEQGFRPERIFSVPYAVDNQRFQSGAKAAAPNRNSFLASLGIPADKPRIVFSGKLTPIKAPEILLAAFAKLGDPWPSLCFVGDGPLRAMLGERARDLGVAERVFFAGFRNQGELPAFYDLADVFALPSRREPWGLVVNEAMNAGRAIVVSDQVGSGPDLVRPGENGSIVPVNDVDRLAAALADALSSPAQTAALGRRSLEIIDNWGFREDIAGLKQALAGIGLPCAS